MSVIGKVLVSLTGLVGVVGVSYYYYSQSRDIEDSSDIHVEEGTDEQVQEEESKEEIVPAITTENGEEKNESKRLEPEIEPDMEDLEGANFPESIEDIDEEEGWSDDKEKAKKRCGEPLDNWISKANLPTHGKNSLGRTYNGWTSCLNRNKFKSGSFSR